MHTDEYTGPFVARPAQTGSATEVVRMAGDGGYEALPIATFQDLTPYRGPTSMDLASAYADRLNKEVEATQGMARDR